MIHAHGAHTHPRGSDAHLAELRQRQTLLRICHFQPSTVNVNSVTYVVFVESSKHNGHVPLVSY